MSKSQLVGEGINNGHMHYYNETVTGHVEWCAKCQCFITGGDCQHENYMPCYERSMYIRLKAKYEAVEHGVQRIGVARCKICGLAGDFHDPEKHRLYNANR